MIRLALLLSAMACTSSEGPTDPGSSDDSDSDQETDDVDLRPPVRLDGTMTAVLLDRECAVTRETGPRVDNDPESEWYDDAALCTDCDFVFHTTLPRPPCGRLAYIEYLRGFRVDGDTATMIWSGWYSSDRSIDFRHRTPASETLGHNHWRMEYADDAGGALEMSVEYTLLPE